MHINLCNWNSNSCIRYVPILKVQNVSCTFDRNWNVCHTVCRGSTAQWYKCTEIQCWPKILLQPSKNVNLSKLFVANYVKNLFFFAINNILPKSNKFFKKFKMMCKIDSNICKVW